MTIIPPRAQRPPVDYAARLFTVADLAESPSDLPSGPVHYELDNGRLLTMPPPGDVHGSVEANFTAAFVMQGQQRGHGRTKCGEVGVVLWCNPDRVVGADVVFVATASLPIRRSAEGYLETMPELVVEVRSKNDTNPVVERKVEDYLTAGVRLVWVADPQRGTVTAYRRDTPPQVFGADDTLTAEDVIPGFALSVRDALQE